MKLVRVISSQKKLSEIEEVILAKESLQSSIVALARSFKSEKMTPVQKDDCERKLSMVLASIQSTSKAVVDLLADTKGRK